jgi:hypothetical protein
MKFKLFDKVAVVGGTEFAKNSIGWVIYYNESNKMYIVSFEAPHSLKSIHEPAITATPLSFKENEIQLVQ